MKWVIKLFFGNVKILPIRPIRYKIQEICYKAVDAFLPTSKFVSDWFATSKMIKKLDSVIFCDDYIVFGDLHYGFCYIF